MNREIVEKNILIAERVPPGDKWNLRGSEEIYDSLTKTLNAWYVKNKEKVEFRLAPLDGKLYIIKQEEIIPAPPETFDIYGENY